MLAKLLSRSLCFNTTIPGNLRELGSALTRPDPTHEQQEETRLRNGSQQTGAAERGDKEDRACDFRQTAAEIPGITRIVIPTRNHPQHKRYPDHQAHDSLLQHDSAVLVFNSHRTANSRL